MKRGIGIAAFVAITLAAVGLAYGWRSASNDRSELRADLTAATARADEVQAERDEVEAERDQKAAELSAAAVDLARVERELSTARSQLDDAEDQIADLEDELAAARSEARSQRNLRPSCPPYVAPDVATVRQLIQETARETLGRELDEDELAIMVEGYLQEHREAGDVCFP